MYTRLLLTTILIFLPSVSHAATSPPQNFTDLVSLIVSLINPLLVLVIGGITLMFLFGLAKFVFSLGSVQNAEEGKQLMLWGAIALFVAVSFWGLVAILTQTFLG